MIQTLRRLNLWQVWVNVTFPGKYKSHAAFPCKLLPILLLFFPQHDKEPEPERYTDHTYAKQFTVNTKFTYKKNIKMSSQGSLFTNVPVSTPHSYTIPPFFSPGLHQRFVHQLQNMTLSTFPRSYQVISREAY